MSVKVELASRTPEALADTAAAITVLTRDDIRRSGASNLPELLRLVPGVYVTRLDASKWAVSIRGFHNRFSNKLLVMIDGRTVYTSLYSGVYWDAEDTYLPDIERIEVIRGPGGSLWGSNAVNGIINIITRHAGKTDGLSIDASIGDNSLEQRFGARYGFDTDAGPVRVFAQTSRFDGGLYPTAPYGNNGYYPVGADASDSWERSLTGFRHDGEHDGQTWQLQGQWLEGDFNQIRIVRPSPGAPLQAVPDLVTVSDQVLQGQYRAPLASGELSIAAFADFREREDGSFTEERDTHDIDVQYHATSMGHWQHDWAVGAGWRESADSTHSKSSFVLWPADASEQVYSLFVHDQITLVPDRWAVALGIKLEETEYTGWSQQPNLRLLWTPKPQRTLWLALSDSVRQPSRSERDAAIVLPGDVIVPLGSDSLETENMRALELGWRERGESISSELTAFRQRYSDLISGVINDPTELDIDGIEWELRWQPERDLDIVAFATWYDDDWRELGKRPIVPRHSHQLRVNWQSPLVLAFSLEYTHNGYFRSSTTTGAVFGDFDVIDLIARWPMQAGEWSLIARNLIDSERVEETDTNRLSSMTEQSLELRYRYRF